MPPEELPLDSLLAVLRAGPPLRLAMLFGSAARGELRAHSDLDLAILPQDSRLSLGAELGLQTALARAVGRNVDLVRLDLAPTLVRWQIARHGRPLLEAGPFEAARFVADAVGEYLDFAPAFDRAGELFRSRLALDARGAAR